MSLIYPFFHVFSSYICYNTYFLESRSHSLVSFRRFSFISYLPLQSTRCLSLNYNHTFFYPTPSLNNENTFTMRTTLATVVALASSFQVASAGWSDAAPFTCPSNTDNHCNTQQSSGWDWGSLGVGSFSSYGGFDFSGFSCASSFGGLSKRDSQFQVRYESSLFV